MSEARVRRLQSLEKCRCERKTCFSKIHSILSDLLRFLQMFWSLAKRAQDLFARAQDSSNCANTIQYIVIGHEFKCYSKGPLQETSCWGCRWCRLWALPCMFEGDGSFWGSAYLRNALLLLLDLEMPDWRGWWLVTEIGAFACGEGPTSLFQAFFAFQFSVISAYFGMPRNRGKKAVCLCCVTMLAKGNNRCPKKRKAVNHFLLDQYIKAAGMLPQKFPVAAIQSYFSKMQKGILKMQLSK